MKRSRLQTVERDDEWRGFRIQGMLDYLPCVEYNIKAG